MTNDEQLAVEVQSAAADVLSRGGGYGDRKVFQAEVYRELPARTRKALTLPAFKERLNELSRAGAVELARADFVTAMDPQLVADSENPYLNATSHFVVVEPTTKPASPKPSAAPPATKKPRRTKRRRFAKSLEGEGQTRARAPRDGRSRRIGVSVTEGEYRDLETAAKRAGLSLAAYCRERLVRDG